MPDTALRIEIIDPYGSRRVLSEALKLLKGLDGPIHFVLNDASLPYAEPLELLPNNPDFDEHRRWRNWKEWEPTLTDADFFANKKKVFQKANYRFRETDVFRPETPAVPPEDLPTAVEPIESLSDRMEKLYGFWEDMQSAEAPSSTFLLLITHEYNSLNAFSGRHADNGNIGFLQVNHFITRMNAEKEQSRAHIPVAYEMLAMALRHLAFPPAYMKTAKDHNTATGCMNDDPVQHEQYPLKLRTADLCPDCAIQVKQSGVSHAIYRQVIQGFENFRQLQLHFRRSRQEVRPIKLIIGRQLIEADTQEKIPLSPKERALYALFTLHPKGIPLKRLPDFADELEELYANFYVHGSPKEARSMQEVRAGMRETVERLVMNTDSACSQTISKINRKIKTHLSKKGDFLPYQIQGADGAPKCIPAADGYIIFDPNGDLDIF